jgi:hypothetical protein
MSDINYVCARWRDAITDHARSLFPDAEVEYERFMKGWM